MGLFSGGVEKNLKKSLKKNMKSGKAVTKMIECPKCHKRMTVTFLSELDKKTCSCGRVIYANKI